MRGLLPRLPPGDESPCFPYILQPQRNLMAAAFCSPREEAALVPKRGTRSSCILPACHYFIVDDGSDPLVPTATVADLYLRWRVSS